MRLTPDDVRSDPDAPAQPPPSRTWRAELAVALLGLAIGLALVLWLLA